MPPGRTVNSGIDLALGGGGGGAADVGAAGLRVVVGPVAPTPPFVRTVDELDLPPPPMGWLVVVVPFFGPAAAFAFALSASSCRCSAVRPLADRVDSASGMLTSRKPSMTKYKPALRSPSLTRTLPLGK